MAGTPIGRILLMPKGDYSGIAVYNALDWVRHAGAAWVCTTDNTTGIAPAIGVLEWQLLAADGSVGGWSTLANKPFETIGKGLTVPTSGAEQDQLKINVDTTMLLGSKLGVNVQNTYSASDVNPISGTGVSQAISGKADSSALPQVVSVSNVTQSADTDVRIPASGTDPRLATSATTGKLCIPVFDNGTSTPVQIKSFSVEDGYATIKIAEAVSNVIAGIEII